MFEIKQEKFEGPLELLLELIEKEKLSINEISLAKVTDDYLSHVKSLGKIDPIKLGEFLVVASQLMLVKSRSLLPGLAAGEEEQGSIAELESRLLEYQRIRNLAKELKKREEMRVWIQSREAYLGIDQVFYPPPKLTVERLREAFALFLAALPKIEKLVEERIRKIVSLEEKITHIRSFLQGSVERAFSEIVKGTREKVEIIVSFLAILELARQKFVELEQKSPFEEILVKRISL